MEILLYHKDKKMTLEELIVRFERHRHRGVSDGASPLEADGLDILTLIKLKPSVLHSSPKRGYLQYDIATNKLKFYNGSGWETITSA